MTRRLRIMVRGAVQGVGFRPFCYRLARELRLSGWVMNTPEGVLIETEGPPDPLREFLLRLEPEAPQHARIQSCESLEIDPVGGSGFDIRPSEISGTPSALVLP